MIIVTNRKAANVIRCTYSTLGILTSKPSCGSHPTWPTCLETNKLVYNMYQQHFSINDNLKIYCLYRFYRIFLWGLLGIFAKIVFYFATYWKLLGNPISSFVIFLLLFLFFLFFSFLLLFLSIDVTDGDGDVRPDDWLLSTDLQKISTISEKCRGMI